ncbi:hypothetical protein MKW94_001733 [Papaver nudicaule]|uniref:Protein kinase domain-containing protein n=1 Tax=Papaver nudicaule TaxID=74823 RepID=A0AA41RW90_PAPNU|nr:hypothetical protein [Papaver nudicaule]
MTVVDADHVKDRFNFDKELGGGNPGCVVYLCKDKITHEYVACKSIEKTSSAYQNGSVKREIEMMIMLRTHLNVVGLKRVYDDDNHVHIVMDFAIVELLYTEISNRIIFSWPRKDGCSDIRLGDFGFATYIQPVQNLERFCGTQYYKAPEILYENPYDQAVDV